MNWLAAAYPWLKALHIIAVIAWMAGLLYLPRLFVYHAGVPMGSDQAVQPTARLAHALGLPGLSLGTAEAVSDKRRMRAALQQSIDDLIGDLGQAIG